MVIAIDSDNVSPIEIQEISIYNVRTRFQRATILAAVSVIGFLFPICDTIYAPALDSMAKSLHTTSTAITISIAAYLTMSGTFSLLWGSLSDRFGRKVVIVASTISFIVLSIICATASKIIVLIIFRSFQGGAVSATSVVGQALVADIYPEESRGTAAGFFFLPFNIGAALGPIIGGPLSGTFGWRSTFIFLTILSCVLLFVVIAFVPETHQYFVKERFHRENPSKRVIDAVPNDKPSFEMPWKPLSYLMDLTILPPVLVVTIVDSTLLTCLPVFANLLGENPYNLSPTHIGLLYIPSGIALLIASLLGGWLSDKASDCFEHGNYLEGRLLPGLILSIFAPIGLLILGWSLYCKSNVAGPTIGLTFISFGQAILEPAVSSYLTIKKQEHAAVVCAADAFLRNCIAGLLLSVSVSLENVIGVGLFLSFLCILCIMSIVFASTPIYKAVRSQCYVIKHQAWYGSVAEWIRFN